MTQKQKELYETLFFNLITYRPFLLAFSIRIISIFLTIHLAELSILNKFHLLTGAFIY